VQAALCGRILRQPLEQDELCANCSRFFKHLLADHCDEYAAALRSHVIGRLQFREYGPDEHIPSVSPMSRSLLTLYGRDIIPEVFTDVFNHETFSWEHHCHAGADRLFLRGRAFAAVYRWTLKTEEKPVITRFWLFTECVFAVLRMKMLALPSSLFDVGCRSESQHRVAAFKTWYDDPGTDKHLRKAALCLRLTLFATNLTAKSNRDPKARPMLVRLADGEIQRRTSELLLTMLPLLGGDAQLDVEAVVFGLLLTQSHIIMRFQQYTVYPCKLKCLCSAYNPAGYVESILEFLNTPDSQLDFGYSLPLKREALAQGGRDQAVEYLMARPRQQEIRDIFCQLEGHSLDVERQHSLVKKTRPTGS
jgi:hypothetical protein